MAYYTRPQQVLAIAFNVFYTEHFPLPDTRAIDWLQSPYMMDREH